MISPRAAPMRRILSAYVLFLILPLFGMARADDFLPPEQAFILEAQLHDAQTVQLRWRIAPGYHLYRERLHFAADAAGAGLGSPALPAGERQFDDNFGKEVETYHGALAVALPLRAQGTPAPFVLTVSYQGCADAGLCYPPMTQAYRVDPAHPGTLQPASGNAATSAITAITAAPGAGSSVTAATAPTAAGPSATAAAPDTVSSAAATAQGAPSPDSDDQTSLARRTLQSGSPLRIGAAFLLFGLLLSFTPCVLPMVPILSAIVVGQSGVTRGKGLLLAGAYSIGMALVYTALGVAAGLAGEGLAGALQKPAVLLTFGALLVALALAMFDVYQLQLPGALQSKLSASSGRLPGGRLAGVFVMGALSALIVGPCVAAPLAGALLYISQTGNAWTGGWALFSMAAGMSVPLLLTGLSAGALLPRAGGWMNGVKKVFGLLLIGVAVWMVSPVLPVTLAMALWGSLAILCAAFLRAGDAPQAGAGVGASARKALGILFLLGGLFELAGAASGGRDVLQPLAHLRAAPAADDGMARQGQEARRFTRVRSVQELNAILAGTQQPVLLDFYADWCVACKEMEKLTFAEPQVAAAMGRIRLLQADVTANDADSRALLKQFELFGPPGIILFNAQGKEAPAARVIGFMPPDEFLRRLQRV